MAHFRPEDFSLMQPALDSPANGGFAITPHDTTDFALATRGIYVGGAGDIVVVFHDDAEVTLAGCLAGSILPIRAKRVNATSTTATNLVGLY